MVIKLKRLNVVKIVESEEKAKALERQGFARVDKKTEQEETQKPAAKGKKAEGGE